MEGHYSDERVRTEQVIQEYLRNNDQWKDLGTMSLGALKIRTQYRRKWHQEKLAKLKGEYHFDSIQFPFSLEYKEIKSQSDYLAQNEPQVWNLLEPALELCPTKPYFFVSKKGEKHGDA